MEKLSPFSRRDMLKAGGAAAAMAAGLPLLPGSVLAQDERKTTQVPGYYRFDVGDLELTIVSDGNITLPTALEADNVPESELKAFLEANYLNPDTVYSQMNVCLINTGDELILVDTGGGNYFQDSAGKLVENLEAAGHSADQIDKVILTHGHPDHCWGVIDDFEETPRFPNAVYFMNGKELDFWTSKDAASRLPENLKLFATGAFRNLNPIKDKTTRTKADFEVSPGIRTIDSFGHTLAHQSVMVEQGSEKLLITGDAIHHWPISFEHPDWTPILDMEPQQAVETRKRLMSMAADEKLTVVGYHMPYPGIGHIARNGNVFRWVPAQWEWQPKG